MQKYNEKARTEERCLQREVRFGQNYVLVELGTHSMSLQTQVGASDLFHRSGSLGHYHGRWKISGSRISRRLPGGQAWGALALGSVCGFSKLRGPFSAYLFFGRPAEADPARKSHSVGRVHFRSNISTWRFPKGLFF